MSGEVPWEEARARGILVVLLVRHGRTTWNAQHRFLGQSDVPLDDLGTLQAAEVARALRDRVAAVYSSPLARAWQTAAHLGVPSALDGVAELDQGLLEGLDYEEARIHHAAFLAAWREDPTGIPVPGGESLDACQARALAALDAVAAAHGPGEVVAVVTHQLVISSLGCHVAAHPLSRWREHAVDNGALTAVCRGPRGWEILVEGWRPVVG